MVGTLKADVEWPDKGYRVDETVLDEMKQKVEEEWTANGGILKWKPIVYGSIVEAESRYPWGKKP